MKTEYSPRVTTDSHAVTLTVDCAIFGFADDSLRVLLVRRAVEPYRGDWVLPGGAMYQNETLEDAAIRVLRDLVNVEDIPMHQVATYSAVNRHPVRRVITSSYFALVSPEDHDPIAREHLDQARWCALNELPELGFDHRIILDDAYEALKQELRSQPLAFHLLPESFTLKEAQEVYEAILGEELDRRNFRRKILSYDFLINTAEKKPGVKGGPELYRVDDVKLEEHMS
ncbi:NUDIX hydrolase [Neolewinella antarctica]|uniref:8-oxo-dGTP diphosphatase n=1 Tax=Neolewinella antarctica TaxID=442734 RepID=A0ABX0XDK8_9BACT|nr:NUDIX domain-containing protein [Neolewinella antarctica]NJC26898.1 8-oxo-dGTP diphosphatase [Neolewinella antarctica]